MKHKTNKSTNRLSKKSLVAVLNGFILKAKNHMKLPVIKH
jgi:hypothetical protein